MIKEVIPMKFKEILCLFIALLFFLFAAHSFAHDTDLYVGQSASIKPNIMILYDDSGSMTSSVSTGNIYDPAITYSPHPDYPTIVATKVYRKPSSGDWFQPLTTFKDSISQVDCSTAQTTLTNKGIYTGNTNSGCSGTNRTLATGNYLNFYLNFDGLVGNLPKREIAKKVITDFLETISGVRVGLATFHPVKISVDKPDGNTNVEETEGGIIYTNIMDIDAGSNRQTLINAVAALAADDTFPWTVLAESLYEVGLYFSGGASYFNSPTTYTTPITDWCQKNYVIVMTDGISTKDENDILKTAIGDRDSDQREPPGAPNDPGYSSYGSDYLDDVAKYLYDTDLVPDGTFINKQNIVTYTIGFELPSGDAVKATDLLKRAATHGHGKFYNATGTAGLTDAFANILNDVLAKTSSFVAPIVPVSKMERTTAGDKIYLAFFRPNQSGMWSGNIKKYGVAQSNDPLNGIVVGDILDSTDSKALDTTGAFYPSTKSFWTTSGSDGGEVEVGGVGEKLQLRATARNIYTLLPGDDQDEDDGPDSNTSFDLTNSWNAFTTANSRLTSSILDVSSGDRDPLINFIRGIDVYDDNYNGSTTDKRDWMLGSFLHSRPFVIHYADRTVIYAGANDGMLHAFNDSDGEELWAFIPPCLLKRLKELHTETPGIFVDGSPKAYVTYDGSGNVTKAILIFGLRRGVDKDGKGYYYALDVTNPTVPKYLWRIYNGRENSGGSTHYYQDLGQTWSTPVIGKVAWGTGEKWVAIFGAGYHDEMDMDNPSVSNITTGRGVYMADVLTGDCVFWKSYPGGTTSMTYPIPGDVATIDLDGDVRIDRLYVGDTNARMWRFDIGDVNKNGSSDTSEWTAKMIFNSNKGYSTKRRIFYPPDVTFEKDSTGEYEMLFFGTGDREDPEGTKDQDRIYAFKDRNASTDKGESDLENVTLFYNKTPEEQTTILNNLKTKDGWYIILDKQAGQKCLATPVVYAKTAYFTSFSPDPASTDPCFVGEGTATLYAVNWTTGEAVFNFDLTNDVGGVVKSKSDRSLIIGTAIPSGVVITVIGGKVTAYIGVGGGVYRPALSSTRSLFPVTWKLVF